MNKTYAGTKFYIVQGGDTPMVIAQKFTSNTMRFNELVAANPQKPTMNVCGYTTFATLKVGEHLNLPDNWPFMPRGPYEEG